MNNSGQLAKSERCIVLSMNLWGQALHEVHIQQPFWIYMYTSASVVKWTTHDFCLMLSESESILCIDFEFHEEKNS